MTHGASPRLDTAVAGAHFLRASRSNKNRWTQWLWFYHQCKARLSFTRPSAEWMSVAIVPKIELFTFAGYITPAAVFGRAGREKASSRSCPQGPLDPVRTLKGPPAC